MSAPVDVYFKPWQKAIVFLLCAALFTLLSGSLQRMPVADALLVGVGGSAIPYAIGYLAAHWLAPTYKTVWALIAAVALTVAVALLALARS